MTERFSAHGMVLFSFAMTGWRWDYAEAAYLLAEHADHEANDCHVNSLVSPSKNGAVPMAIHELHPNGWIARSHTFPDIYRYCCDNCDAHHWGRYVRYPSTPSGPEEYDFEWRKPNNQPYAGGYPC
jgi:hypothetical protein